MRVMQVVRNKGTLILVEADMPEPRPAKGELLVRVHAAGVTPTELFWYPTTHNSTGKERKFAIPGHEFSGVIASIGESVTDFAPGDPVFGMNDWFAEGATADYCLTTPESLAPKPDTLTHEEAASVPIGALTAWQGLFEKADLKAGQRILIHGAAGAVGLFAVQLARLHGATVIATASAKNLSLVSDLGASTAIDYKASRFEDHAGDLDVVFDTVGGDTLQRSWPLLRPSGRVVTIAADAEGTVEQRVKDAFFIVKPNTAQLASIADLLAAGKLQTFVKAAVPFDQAPAAYARGIDGTHGIGKVVLVVHPDRTS